MNPISIIKQSPFYQSFLTQFTAYKALVTFLLQRTKRDFASKYASAFISGSLSVVIFGGIIGDLLGPVSGVSFISFLLPGLITTTVISSASLETSLELYLMKYDRSISDILTSPIYDFVTILSFLTLGMMRALISAFFTMFFTFVFYGFQLSNPLGAVALILLISIASGLIGMIAGTLANDFSQAFLFSTVVVTTVSYFSGTFFDINNVPFLVGWIARLNPMFYLAQWMRGMFLGVELVNEQTMFLTTVLSIIVLFAYALRVYDRTLRD